MADPAGSRRRPRWVRRVRWVRRSAAVVAAAVLAAGCSDGDDGDEAQPDPSATTVAAAVGPPLRTTGFDAEVIRLGVVVDLTGPGAADGAAWLSGVELYWAAVDAEGGVAGRYPVELVVVDSGGDLGAAVEAYREVRTEVVAMALVHGAETVDTLRPALADDGIRAVPSGSRLAWLDDPQLLVTGTPEEFAAVAGVRWLASASRDATTWCLLTGDGGGASLSGARVELAEQSLTVGFEAAVDAAPAVETAQALAENGCEVVWSAAPTAAAVPVLDVLAAGDVDLTVGAAGTDHLVGTSGDEAATAWFAERVIGAVDVPLWPPGAVGGGLDEAIELAAPDAVPTVGMVHGWASQVVLRRLLEDAVVAGSLNRDDLAARSADLGVVENDLVSDVVVVEGDAVAGAGIAVVSADPGGADQLGLRHRSRGAVESGAIAVLRPPPG